MSQPFFDQAHQEVQAEADWLAWPDADSRLSSPPSPNVPGNGGKNPAALVATQALGLSRLSVNQRH